MQTTGDRAEKNLGGKKNKSRDLSQQQQRLQSASPPPQLPWIDFSSDHHTINTLTLITEYAQVYITIGGNLWEVRDQTETQKREESVSMRSFDEQED